MNNQPVKTSKSSERVIRGMILQDSLAEILPVLAERLKITPNATRPSIQSLGAAMGSFVRAAINEQFKTTVKKQVSFAAAISNVLSSGDSKTDARAMLPGLRKSNKSKSISQPYVASILKNFLPSFERLAAVSTVLQMTPSTIVRAGEIVCALNGGRASPGERYPWMGELITMMRSPSIDGLTYPTSQKISSSWIHSTELSPAVRAVFSAKGIGWSIYEVRRLRGLSQLDLSRIQVQSGKSKAKVQFGTAISQIERGEYNPSWPHLSLLAEMLQVLLSDIIFVAEACTYDSLSSINSQTSGAGSGGENELQRLYSRLDSIHKAARSGDRSAMNLLEYVASWSEIAEKRANG